MPDWLPHIQILNGNLPARRINQRSGWKTFIHDDKVKGIQLAGLVVHALNSGDNDLLRGVAAPESGGIDADLQFRTELADLVGILFEKFLDMGEEQHPTIPFFNGGRLPRYLVFVRRDMQSKRHLLSQMARRRSASFEFHSGGTD